MASANNQPIRHFADPQHPLWQTQYRHDEAGLCNICLLKLAGRSSSLTYGCYACNIHLHSACARYFQEAVSFFAHPAHTLTLRRSPGRRVCDVCRGDCPRESFVYSCIGCGFDVHPLCSMLPERTASRFDPSHQLCMFQQGSHGAVSQQRSFGTAPAVVGYNPVIQQGYGHAGQAPAGGYYYYVPPTHAIPYGPAMPSNSHGYGASGGSGQQQSTFHNPSSLMSAIARFLLRTAISAVASDLLSELLSGSLN